ncbi:unnamed protein product [Prunus armeniaca]
MTSAQLAGWRSGQPRYVGPTACPGSFLLLETTFWVCPPPCPPTLPLGPLLPMLLGGATKWDKVRLNLYNIGRVGRENH